MKILFIHTNFPAQFRNLANELKNTGSNQIVAVGAGSSTPIEGVRLLRYPGFDGSVAATHPFARRFDLECRRAEQVLYVLSTLSASGFVPDVVFGHPGWGECLPLRTVFKTARFVAYCEFFYGPEGRDVGFDPEFPTGGLDGAVGLHLKNAASLFAVNDCDRGLAPTAWQRSTFPEHLQQRIDVIHDGVDTDAVRPVAHAALTLPSGVRLSRAHEVVTFVARNLEPLRGYHVFMRALPRILAARPNAHVLIVGGEGVSYGAPAPPGTTWKARFLAEVAGQIDPRRVHFLGALPYAQYLSVLRVSSVHVYLTYPFVLSWSLLEAMSAGCMVVGSDTAPVREVIDGTNGLLVPFFDVEGLAERVVSVLADRHAFEPMRQRARQTVVEGFDLRTRSLPAMLRLVGSLQERRTAKAPRPPLPSVIMPRADRSAPPARGRRIRLGPES